LLKSKGNDSNKKGNRKNDVKRNRSNVKESNNKMTVTRRGIEKTM
jgi:hypothetical protein